VNIARDAVKQEDEMKDKRIVKRTPSGKIKVRQYGFGWVSPWVFIAAVLGIIACVILIASGL
jgi:hypothetical protein